MKNAISWFEIPVTHLDKAQAFYEATLACTLRREAMGPSDGAVFPYDNDEANGGVGGALLCGPTARPLVLPAHWCIWMPRHRSTRR